jgi:hypothetical protein
MEVKYSTNIQLLIHVSISYGDSCQRSQTWELAMLQRHSPCVPNIRSRETSRNSSGLWAKFIVLISHNNYNILNETMQISKNTTFWDITLCNSLKVNRRFGGTYRLHLQDQDTRVKAGAKSNGILLGLFDPEDTGDIFLRNVG